MLVWRNFSPHGARASGHATPLFAPALARLHIASAWRGGYIPEMQPSFEIFDHTADAGIRIVAPTLPELLKPAGDGLYAVIGTVVPSAEPPQRVSLDLTGSDPSLLLRDYLHELLILFERDDRIVTAVEQATFESERLTAGVQATLADRAHSAYHREVKAITYHELEIRSVPGGYEATVIVDI